ncbi:ABC transporter ATP-binding protein [Rhodococcus fascians]|nr:ABC transporter ATP-binding protein [Rhodococcus fascians]
MTTSPALHATGLSVTYGRSNRVLKDIDLVVPQGSSVGLVGESGSGKSTLAKALVDLVPPAEGKVEVFGRQWSSVGRRDPIRRRIQMIFQDPYGALNPRLSALDAVAEAVTVTQGSDRRAARSKALELLSGVGLAESLVVNKPTSMSGGQRQRVAIARALACEPEVLVADEPTSALDLSVQAQILNLLMDLKTERNLTLVLISHDLSVVSHLCGHVAVMLHGRIVEQGTVADVLDKTEHPYTRKLVDAFTLRGVKSHSA